MTPSHFRYGIFSTRPREGAGLGDAGGRVAGEAADVQLVDDASLRAGSAAGRRRPSRSARPRWNRLRPAWCAAGRSRTVAGPDGAVGEHGGGGVEQEAAGVEAVAAAAAGRPRASRSGRLAAGRRRGRASGRRCGSSCGSSGNSASGVLPPSAGRMTRVTAVPWRQSRAKLSPSVVGETRERQRAAAGGGERARFWHGESHGPRNGNSVYGYGSRPPRQPIRPTIAACASNCGIRWQSF